MRGNGELKLRRWQYWILFELSESPSGRLALVELKHQVYERMKSHLTEVDHQPTKESKGRLSWETQFMAALNWGERSLKQRELIRNVPRSEVYEVTEKGRLAAKGGPPDEEEDFGT